MPRWLVRIAAPLSSAACAIGCTVACAPDVLPVPHLDAPDLVTVPEAPIGVVTTIRVPIQNVGTADARVALTATGPLVVPERVEVPVGARLPVLVAVVPTDLGSDRGTILLRTAYEQRLVDVAIDVDPDADDDGVAAVAAGGADCDDFDPTRAPGHPETCDGRDEDCDGLVDEDPIDAATFFRDADRDGWGDDGTTATACARPAGFVDAGGDCDDADAGVHPGALERWYDGVDQDCDGASDFDADADGWDSLGHGGADCRDRDPRVNPDAPELPDDGVDQDCDGFVDERRPVRGELVISEVLPVGVAGPAFVELAAVSDVPLALLGIPLGTPTSTRAIPDVVVPADGVAVLCVAEHPSCDGVIHDLEFAGALELAVGAALDVVPLDRLPHSPGISAEAMVLDPDDNDAPAAWCASRVRGPTGDLGTPGEPASCP